MVAQIVYLKMSKANNYSLCKLRDRGGDLSKRWYIEFYVFDTTKGKTVRIMDRSMNRFKFDDEYKDNPAAIKSAMYAEMHKIKRVVDEKLKSGWVITGKKEVNTRPDGQHVITGQTALTVACDAVFEEKERATYSDKSRHAYKVFRGLIKSWAKATGNQYVPVFAVNFDVLNSFISWYKLRRNPKTGELISNSSINKQVVFLRAFFNELIRRGVITNNPAKRLSKLKTIVQSHVPYMDYEIITIKKQLEKKDPQLLVVCEVIYYCAIRRHELRYAQVDHIRDGKWLIPGKITYKGKTIKVSKNGLPQSVVIPNQILEKIKSLGWLDYPGHYFIFGGRGRPSPSPHGRDNLTTRYREKVKEPLELGPEKTLYGWKHTGVCKLYKKFKDPDMVRRHCRHSTLEMTMIYLRSLDLFDQQEIAESFPDF